MSYHKAYHAALEWHLDQGVDEVLIDEPVNRFAEILKPENPVVQQSSAAAAQPVNPPILGKTDAQAEAVKLAQAAQTLEELREAIAGFDGLSLKKTATNMVFADGNSKASVMIVGEAPGADEDRLGKPFVGLSGQLLDRILKFIDLDRYAEEPEHAVYISNILNWRPPGNRTPSPAEIAISLPFIERHIQLIQPKILILCGGVPAKALLGRSEGISRLRKTWHDYVPQTAELASDAVPIPALATYHPAYLLRTPTQKRSVWLDMLEIQQKHRGDAT